MLIDEATREAILAPIAGGVGVDGRQDEGPASELLRELRLKRKERVRAEQAAAVDDEESALPEGVESWESIAEEAINYLVEYGKDLDPMATVIEASAREEDAPESLATAMSVLAEMVETYWDQGLYPPADEDEADGVEARFLPLSGLSGGSTDREGALILPVRQMVLLKVGSDVLRYSDKVVVDAQSQNQAGDEEAKAERAEARQAAYEKFERLATVAGRSNMEPVLAAVTTAETEWRRAIEFIMKQASPYMPAASRLTGELTGIREWLTTLVGRLPQEAAAEEGEGEDGAPGAQSAAGSGSGKGFVAGKITTREQALEAVKVAADYFARSEPHSPVGKALREIDRRARMGLQDLIAELIPGEAARTEFYWRSGIRPPSEGGSSSSDEYEE